MSYDVSGAKKGQAMNLATYDAIARNKENDVNYIYKKYVWYLHLAEIITGTDTDLIQQAINSPDFNVLIEKLQEVFKHE